MQYRQQASTKPRILSSPQRWRPPQTANTRELGSSRGKRLADEGGVALGEVTADRSSSTSAPTGTTARRSASRTSAVHSLPHRYGRCTSASAAHSMLEVRVSSAVSSGRQRNLTGQSGDPGHN